MDNNSQALTLSVIPSLVEKMDFYTAKEVVREYINQERKSYLFTGYMLKFMNENKEYRKTIQDSYGSWHSFLMQEYKFSEGNANHHIRVYEYYYETLKMPEEEILKIHFGTLVMLKHKIENLLPERRDEIIEKAKVLSEGDLRKELVDIKLMPPKKINIYHCGNCEKLKIEYRLEKMCTCSGHPHIEPMKDY